MTIDRPRRCCNVKPPNKIEYSGESTITYLAELRSAWRPLLAATIGLGTGMSTVGTVTSAIAPTLVEDAGWSRAEFALVGSLALVTAFAFPFVGRLADVIGVRYTALIGMITLPLAYFAYSLVGDDLRAYVAIFVVQSLLCVTTTATVYTRLVVQHIERARGLALAIAVSGSAVTGAIGGPILNAYVEANGWRASYEALAIFSVVAAIVTFLLIPPERKNPAAPPRPKRRARDDYPAILRSPVFWILLGAMLLCNLPATIMLVQLKMLLLANGITGDGAAIMFTALSVGMLVGRFVAGVALDRYPAHIVSFLTLAMPSMGLFIIASSFDAPPLLAFAVFCIGFAFGAEGDIVGFLVARQFGVQIYGSVMGLLTCAISFSTASGAALLSVTMAATGGYDLYLVISGTGVLIGATLLLLLGRTRAPEIPAPEARTAG
jgi:predicted MFS family arabinose efflux permease